jgi:hypothetical protein
MMPVILTTLRERVAKTLADSGGAVWSAADLDEAIRQALQEYSRYRAYETYADLTIPAAGREVDISTLNAQRVRIVWLPFDVQEFPPVYVPFEHWIDRQKLFILGDNEPQAGDVARLFYTTAQQLAGLDGAASTTFPPEDESLICTGAAAYAALSRALGVSEQVTIDKDTTEHIRTWGRLKLADFRTSLRRLSRNQRSEATHVPLPLLDRHDGDWQ